jgi:uncharacterized DUF497 family protein
LFEWDNDKRLQNLEKHGIDFIAARELWSGPVLEAPSPRTQHREERIIAIGKIYGRCIAVVYTWRNGNRRLISARKARKNEQEAYKKAVG